jgi:RimJ/RimL family protein N-acetyltransferase
MVSVRLAQADDWQRYREVRLLALTESPDAFGSTLERELAFDEATWRSRVGSGACFLAIDPAEAADSAGAVVGTASGYADRQGPAHERLLVGMWIAASHRGQGIAADLIAAVVAWARVEGATVVRLEVAEFNRAAQRAYRRAGFEFAGQRTPMPRDPRIVEQAMTLRL